MTEKLTRHLFVSYSRQDAEIVTQFIETLRFELRVQMLPVNIWMDIEDLRPGEQWANVIGRALTDSLGLLVFVSRASMQSEWVRAELRAAATATDRLIVPIILEHVKDLPEGLALRQWLDLTGRPTSAEFHEGARKIAEATSRYLADQKNTPPVPSNEVEAVAKNLASAARESEEPSAVESKLNPQSAFIVHGHDETALAEVTSFLASIGVKPIVLSQLAGAEQSLFQKFLRVSQQARFAIVILSADDTGASRVQYEASGVGERSLQFRARQNVILELGFFYGRLGWENVFVLYRKADRVFPNFERPSDLDGVIFDPIDERRQWHTILRERLIEAGFELKNVA